MGTRAAEELLYDSEMTLRLVDNVLDELELVEADVSRSEDRARALYSHVQQAQGSLEDLPRLLLHAYGEIQKVLDNLRQSRTVLERAALERFHSMNAQLREVTSATEVAATDILNGLDRAMSVVDRCEAGEEQPAEQRRELYAELRNELFGVMSCVQFQDITSQQLNYASSVLHDLELRLTQLAQIFDESSLELTAKPAQLGLLPPATTPVGTFDPAATMQDAAQRQALVDEIFGG